MPAKRVNPMRCSQVRLGVRITVLLMDATWPPAESCCGNPNRVPTDSERVRGGIVLDVVLHAEAIFVANP